MREEILSTEVIPSRGFQSSVDYRTHFGLGNATSADSVVVIWPNRLRSVLKSVPADTFIILDQPSEGRVADEFGTRSTKAKSDCLSRGWSRSDGVQAGTTD